VAVNLDCVLEPSPSELLGLPFQPDQLTESRPIAHGLPARTTPRLLRPTTGLRAGPTPLTIALAVYHILTVKWRR